MKKVAALLILLVAALGQAQEPLRLLVLPFDANRSFEPYGLGVATGLQRTLNAIDGIYVPSVAEAGLLVTRAHEAGRDAVEFATTAFGATVVVTGAVSGSEDVLNVTLAFGGSAFEPAEQVSLQLPNEPSAVVEGVALATLDRIGRNSEQTSATARSLAAESPDIASLEAVATASSRLGANVGDLTAAAGLNPASSWTLAEQARALALAGRTEEALEAASRAVQDNPADVEAQVVRGIIADSAGDPELARESFAAALELNAHHALALVGMAQWAADESEARTLLERALASSPRQADALIQLARMENSPQRTLQLLRRYSDNLPESVEVHRAFIDTAIAAGDPAGAAAYLRQTLADPLAASAALYGLAAALPDESLDDAIAIVQEGRQRYPQSSGLELTEADLLVRAGRTTEALALLDDLHSRFPDSVQVANSYAIALARDGQLDRAREVLGAVSSDNTAAQVNLGRILLQSGQARSAVSVLEPLAEAEPEDSEVLALYGVALGRTGRLDEATEVLDRAIELDPDNAEAANARNVLRQQRQIVGDGAVAFEGEAATAFERGLQLLEEDDPQAAADSFARARELSGHPLAAFYEGYSLQRAGRTRDAVPAYQAALEGYPESDTVLNNLGYAQLQLGRLDLALDTLRRAAAANDGNSSVHVNLGLTYYGLGRYAEAIAAWDAAIAIDPGLEDDLAEIRARAQERRAP